MDKLLNVKEASNVLGVGQPFMRKLYAKGLIQGLIIGQGVKFRTSTIEKFIEKFEGQNVNKILKKMENS